ncbi:MAG: glycosyltransferase, partial [Candidatus Dormibacteraeota bacterium]|nr:glycosyltransferase [Candidatus Dormibacteraeota bacterium]
MSEAEPLLARVAVVVVSYNTEAALRDTLHAVTRGGGAALEVVVVDNASGDGSAAMVHDTFPAVRLITEGVNHGFGAAANIAATATQREFLLFLNPDCGFPSAGVEELARRLVDDPGLGFAGPRIDLGPGRVDHACLRADPDPLGAALYFSRLTRLFPNSARVNRYSLRHLDYDQEQELQAGTAACLMVRHG